MQQKLNIFQLNFKLLNISGVIPTDNINSSSWKTALFRIYQTLSFLLFITMMILQFLAIYYYWGNIYIMADIIGFLAALAAVSFISSYTIIFWKNICDVTHSFETNSIFCSELVTSNQKHMKILNETLNRAQMYVKLIFTSEMTVAIFTEISTIVQHLMTSDEEILQEVETVDGFEKYFIFVIWLPPVVKQKYFIRVIYGLQCICTWELSLFTAAIISFYTVLFICTGIQFKLISSIIREMDEVICRVENAGNIIHDVPKQLFTTDTKEPSESFQSTISKKLLLQSNLHIEEPTALSTERILSSKMQRNFLQEDDINRQSERIHKLSSPEIKSTTKNDPESVYLVECIKLHQACIK